MKQDSGVTRVVVADRAEARFYDSAARGTLAPAGSLEHPRGRLHERELLADRPGRVFDRTSPAGDGTRGGHRHAMAPGQSPSEHEAETFARTIAASLERSHQAGEFTSLVVMAGPQFLGLLRGLLSSNLRKSVIAEVPKDLVHGDEDAVRSHLPSSLAG